MIVAVGLAHDVWIVLQDALSWIYHYPKHWISKHIVKCIHRTKDDKVRTKIKTFIEDGMKNVKILQEGYDLSRRQNSIRESNINHHTSNCVSIVGVQITIHHDSLYQNTLLKKVEISVSNNNKMCILITKMLANSNLVKGYFSVNLLKCWSECNGETVDVIHSVFVTNEENNFRKKLEFVIICKVVEMLN